MGLYIKYMLPVILGFFMLASYFKEDRVFMLIMALGNMAIFWMIGRVHEKERG